MARQDDDEIVTIFLRPHPPNTSTSSKQFQSWPVIRLVVPIGVSHISSWLQEIQSKEWEERTKNKRTIRTWVNSRRLSCDTLHSLCICRLTVAWIFCEISTNHEECWLILTALLSLLLDSISCRLVSSVVRCRLPTALLPRPSLTPLGSFFQLFDSRSFA